MTFYFNYTKRMNTDQLNEFGKIAFTPTLTQLKNKHRNEIQDIRT